MPECLIEIKYFIMLLMYCKLNTYIFSYCKQVIHMFLYSACKTMYIRGTVTIICIIIWATTDISIQVFAV